MAGVRILMAAALGAAWLGLVPRDAAAQKRQRDLITREELEHSIHHDKDLYRAVRALRPHFLERPRGTRSMGQTTMAPTVLYIDGTRQGDLDALRIIMVTAVQEVQYLDPAKAQEAYGVTHSGGAVLVKLRPPLRPTNPPPPGRSDASA